MFLYESKHAQDNLPFIKLSSVWPKCF